jgi:hypothetical protein
MAIIKPKSVGPVVTSPDPSHRDTFYDDYGAPHFSATIAILASVIAAFNAALWLGGMLLGFVTLWVVLLYVAHHRSYPSRGGWQKFGAVCYIFAVLVIGVGGGIVIGVQAGYTQVGWTGTILFALGLVLDVMPRLGAFLNLIAAALVAAMVAGLVLMPVPREAGAWGNEARDTWNIEANVTDENGDPVSGAFVFCGSVMKWEANDPTVLAAGYPNATDESGHATFLFHEDSRMKVAACAAYLPPGEGSAGMAAQAGIGGTIIPGADIPVDVRLDSRRPFTVQCGEGNREEERHACYRQRLATARE